MKKILILLALVASFSSSFGQTLIVGHSGNTAVNGNPNANAALALQDLRYESWYALDTVNQILYKYNSNNAAGAKWEVLAAGVQSVVAGTGNITVTTASGVVTINNTDPDQSITNEGFTGVVAGSATSAIIQWYNSAGTAMGAGTTVNVGTGLSITETTSANGGQITVTNTAPDQTVAITGAGINTVTGTYPNFTVTGTEVDGSTTNELVTSFSLTSGNVTLVDAGGTKTIAASAIAPIQSVATTGTGITTTTTSGVVTINAVDASLTNEIQTISATAPTANSTTIANSLAGGSFTLSTTSPLSLTGSANAPVIGFGALVAYDNPVAAGAGGVPMGGWFEASATNTMGYVAGTPVIRRF